MLIREEHDYGDDLAMHSVTSTLPMYSCTLDLVYPHKKYLCLSELNFLLHAVFEALDQILMDSLPVYKIISQQCNLSIGEYSMQ